VPKRTTITEVSHTGPGPATQAAGGAQADESSNQPFERYDAMTKEGPVTIEQNGNDLLIMEGYDNSVVEKARQVLFFNMTLPQTVHGKPQN
jgi:hypothetical protein